MTTIRAATVEDAPAIAVLVTELGYATSSDAMLARLDGILGDSTYATLVAEAGNDIVGVAGGVLGRFYDRDGVCARIVLLSVAARSQRSGIGTKLVHAIEAWSKAHGALAIVVNTGEHRSDAQAFYAHTGFARTGVRFIKQLAPSA